jgi:bifunctional UDP-N-acetylglucosamine pyrophosphorylase/glucosamine-1-phosphate N-acetyltransferase
VSDWSAIILAAGAGSRMRSRLPKILHPVAGLPMLLRVLGAVRGAGVEQSIVVLGPATDEARAVLGAGVSIAFQAEALGTADAVRAAANLARTPQVLVLNGDLPLIRPETLTGLMRAHELSDAALTLLSAIVPDPTGVGRLRRGPNGDVLGVVEEREVNAGAYCVRAGWLWSHLESIQPSPATGELYLTELVRLAAEEGAGIATLEAEADEVRGVNTRAELAAVEAVARQRTRSRLMAEGVTLIDPATTFVDDIVRVGRDTVIQPHTHLWGDTVVGESCELGPSTMIRSSQIGDNCRIVASLIEDALVEENVEIGPFSHLRPGASIAAGVELGNYAEVKQSRIGPGSRMHHFGYIGDATVGADVNIGAGTITCNYDGHDKHETRIGDHAFVGSDTMLVAPVRLGEGARTGAGSVVTRDVGAGVLVAGVPARPLRREPPDAGDQPT